MNIKERLSTITSPYGEVIFYDNYGTFVPYEGEQFCPVLVHVDYKDLDEALVGVINDTINCDTPPLFLFTYGNKFANVASLVNSWKEDGVDEVVNAVVSIHNDSLGILGGWATFYDNLPEGLEELISNELKDGKFTTVGNKLAENIGCVLNKPVLSLNFFGDTEEYDTLHNIINFIPPFPNYNYNEAITNWQPVANKEDTCCLCTKRRAPLKFFYKLQGFLCPVCEKKVKERGAVTLENFCAVGLELKQQRVNTRRANLSNVLVTNKHTCLDCGGDLTYVGNNKYLCGCKKIWWVHKNTFLEIRIVMSKEFVYEYSVRNTGYKKLVRTTPLNAHNSPVQTCDCCYSPQVTWTWIKHEDEAYRLCHDCAVKYKEDVTKIKQVIEAKQEYLDGTKQWR